MNNADLKRKLSIGQKVKLVYRFKKLDEPILKQVVKTQSNGVYLKNIDMLDSSGNGSYLDFYPASLVEVDGKGFKLFSMGSRPMTEQETAIVKGYEAIRDKKQEEIDVLTDGSTTFWQEKGYYQNNDASYLFGGYSSRSNRWAKRRDFNSPKQDQVFDPSIKGQLELEYQWV